MLLFFTAGTYDYAKDKRREKAAKQKKLKELEEARKKSEHVDECAPLTDEIGLKHLVILQHSTSVPRFFWLVEFPLPNDHT